MEYIPYIFATGLFGSSLNYFINYSVDNELHDNENYDLKNNLGNTFKEKRESIIKICKDECKLKMNMHSKKRFRDRIKKYIREYEKVGHVQFVLNHIQIK